MKRLQNKKACGPDDKSGELLKYGGDVVTNTIATIINQGFTNGEDMAAVIGQGTLIALQKPNKPKVPATSRRPIVLLNTVRKVMSHIVLGRISTAVSAFLGPTLSGFRSGRSTADIFWTQRWMAAKCQRYRCSIHMLGLDMSQEFDTIPREKLLQVMAKIVHPDELQLIHLLLYGTTLIVRQGSYTTSSFSSTVGTPQGDGLSPVLFVYYLEAALKYCRNQLPPRPASDSLIPHETGYADDINFYSTVLKWLQIALPIIARTLRTWSLNVNEAKTEWVELVSGGNLRATKQLGSLLGDAEDVMRRVSLASQLPMAECAVCECGGSMCLRNDD